MSPAPWEPITTASSLVVVTKLEHCLARNEPAINYMLGQT